MNGTKFLAYTNVFINLSEGKGDLETYLDGKDLYVSVVSEIELLGWYKISDEGKLFFEALLDDCLIVELIPAIKEHAIRIKQHHRIKPPDAIIAAIALFLGIPLLTFNSDFAKNAGLNLVLLEL